MIVVVGLHMVQVFLYGAYKKPRETTWIVGVVLLLVTLAFGLTGYLLPWDNRAYWGTVVTTQIAGMAPVLGPYMTHCSAAETGWVWSLSRASTGCMSILPPATILLIALHILLVRRHGVAPAPGDELVPKVKFFRGRCSRTRWRSSPRSPFCSSWPPPCGCRLSNWRTRAILHIFRGRNGTSCSFFRC